MNELDAKIIVVFARGNMNRAVVCRKLHYAPNTICYHLDRVKKITGLDPRNFFDLHELYAIACNILGDEANEI